MEILDSGERRIFDNGFQRDMSEGKGAMYLLPWTAIMQLSKHCEEGAKKYGEYNINKGCPQHSLLDSALRHLAKYMEGWDDEPHLVAALWNIAWAVQQETTHPEMLNLPFQIAKRKALEESDDKADREKLIDESGEPKRCCFNCAYFSADDCKRDLRNLCINPDNPLVEYYQVLSPNTKCCRNYKEEHKA